MNDDLLAGSRPESFPTYGAGNDQLPQDLLSQNDAGQAQESPDVDRLEANRAKAERRERELAEERLREELRLQDMQRDEEARQIEATQAQDPSLVPHAEQTVSSQALLDDDQDLVGAAAFHESELVDPDPGEPDPRVMELEPDDFQVPGAVPRLKPAILQTPEEKEAQLKVILDEELAGLSNSRHVVLDFGPFEALEQNLRRFANDAVPPEIGNVLMQCARQALHETVISKPGLSAPERTEAGLKERIIALREFGGKFADSRESMIEKITELGLDLSKVRAGFDSVIASEQRRLELRVGKLVPPTLGSHLLGKLNDFRDSLSKKMGGDADLTGNIRQHRNELLTKALDNLESVTAELSSNAGDLEWERSVGPMATKVAREMVDEIKGLTKGVEDQVDYNVLNKRLSECCTRMEEASEIAADEEHKNRMKQVVEAIAKAIEAITAAVAKALGLRKDQAAPTRSTP